MAYFCVRSVAAGNLPDEDGDDGCTAATALEPKSSGKAEVFKGDFILWIDIWGGGSPVMAVLWEESVNMHLSQY